MGKCEQTIYTCDRCHKVINGDAHSVGMFHYMHVLKWYCPVSGYRLAYLCNDCYKELKEFLTAKKEAEHGRSD